MGQTPPPYCLKAVELGLLDPELVVPRAWMYDYCILCPESTEDCLAFLRNHGLSSEVDDNTFLALLAAAFSRRTLNAKQITGFLVKRFAGHAVVDAGVRNCLAKLNDPEIDPQEASDICARILEPYNEFAESLMASMPEPVW